MLILGGGINGAGVALDAAARGWRVALIDKGDFAAGTSSASSKLIHGGLRYLERGHVGLVYEALRERRWLGRAAPHLVRPLPFVLPYYQSGRLRPWQWRLGLTVYDLLAGADNLKRSRPLPAPQLRRLAPTLAPAGLLGGAAYYDALMDDARLCLAVVQTAVAHGACVANYVEAVAFEMAGGTIAGVQARDRVSGDTLVIRARQVVNAAGPWVDAVCRLAGDAAGPHLQPTKGVHVILPDCGLPAAFLLLHPRDGRVFFVIPWMGKTLLGTTDTVTPEGPDALAVAPEEIAYLRDGWAHYFPVHASIPVLGSFAGLRPLIRAELGATPSARTREYRVFTSPSGLVSVAGGKYTTFRAMAEDIVNLLGERLGRTSRCRTQRLLLHGTPSAPWEAFRKDATAKLTADLGLPDDVAGRLVDRYGVCVDDVARYLGTPAERERLVEGEPELRGELAYQRAHEMAVFPADHVLRRTRVGLYCPQAGLGSG
ncbi:MAG: glycerol-3-phosphate dehydrogenase/oxidase [Gemmataceae bacterium]|nr:glycerol-3-phosphate dehydrogenase/oxidase [Gemmataceae bacterium]